METSSFYLRFTIIKFYFENAILVQETNSLVSKVLTQKFIQDFMKSQLTDLLKKDFLVRNATELVNEKLLLQNVLIDFEITQNLGIIIEKVIASENTKNNLIELVLLLLKLKETKVLFIEGIETGLTNPTVKDIFAMEIINSVYEKLHDKELLKEAKKKLKSEK